MKNQAVSGEPPNSADALNQQAKRLIQERRYDEAASVLHASLKINETPAAYRYLGVMCRFRKDFKGALQWLEKSLKVDAQDHATLQQLAETYFDAGDYMQATAYYAFAICHNPQDLFYKERFIGIGAKVAFSNYTEIVEAALTECLATRELDCTPAQAFWYNTFHLNPAFQPFYKMVSAGGLPGLAGRDAGSFDRKHFDQAGDYRPLLRPFFILGLQNITVCSLVFEDFVGALRQALLNAAGAPAKQLSRAETAVLAGAVANYSFNNEYAIDLTTEEETKLAALRQRIETGENILDNLDLVAIYGCYFPLHALANAREIEAALADVPDLAALRGQLAEHFELQRLRGTITAVTPIDDAVSQKVREMYEESPYPRWKAIPRNFQLDANGKTLQQKKGAQILIAGCGTGHEAIQYAVLFPDAEVLAVDLSLSSLSYAIYKAKDYKLNNITFRQGDILHLGTLNRQFDCVVSAGVLHHLKDPFRGWQVLAGLLKPDGVMKIGLYSKLARRDLLAAHKIIREQGKTGLDLKGMRRFRRDSEKILGKNILSIVSSYDDYYYLSMYRDMMFHVQEHDPDLHEIEDDLNRLGLKFLRFVLPRETMAKFAAAFPKDPEGASLKNWQQFEPKNPSTFSACYVFWCDKICA